MRHRYLIAALSLAGCELEAGPVRPLYEAGVEADFRSIDGGSLDAGALDRDVMDRALAPDARLDDAGAGGAGGVGGGGGAGGMGGGGMGGDIDAALPIDAGPGGMGGAPDMDVDHGGGGMGGAPVDPDAPARYLAGRLHSPLTASVRDGLRAIAADANRTANSFAKIGDSLTVSGAFMRCFSGADALIDLDGRDDLWDAIEHFRSARIDPFRRESAAATVGWSASSALNGNPSPIRTELMALDPQFAVVMFGTNDIQRRNIVSYAEQMLDIADLLIREGVIPIFSSIPPRGDDLDADYQVPAYNAVVRGIAQGRQVPFVDLEMALRPIDDYGLAGDNLHGSAYRQDGQLRPCAFTPAALENGYNWRNLLTIEALQRMHAVVLGDAAPPDAPGPPLRGNGTAAAPFIIDTLPFTHLHSTADAPSRRFDAYPGCDAPQDESGPEVLYRLDIDASTTLRAYVFDRGAVDIDVHMLGDLDADACLGRHDSAFAASLDPGTWYFSLDTFVGRDGVEDAGEYLFVLVADP